MENLFGQASNKDNADDFYTLLGCTELSSYEQIETEFKIRAKECHPDKTTDPELKEKAEANFMALNKAHTILKDPSTRDIYDNWRRIGLAMPFDQYLEMQSRCRSTFHFISEKPQPSIADHSNNTNTKPRPLDEMQHQRPMPSNPLNQFREGGRTAPNGGDLLNKFRSYKL